MVMKWNEEQITQVLKEMRALEQFPPSQRRSSIRAQLVNAGSIDLYALETRLGWIGIDMTLQGIRYLQLPCGSRSEVLQSLRDRFPDGMEHESSPERIATRLRDYAEGQCRFFDLPVDWAIVRPFQREVLQAISDIPFGETRSYGWVARAIGRPGASRAVGQALSTNPIPIIIPCHRVIAADGTLGGYAGGLHMKRVLLELEGSMPKSLVEGD